MTDTIGERAASAVAERLKLGLPRPVSELAAKRWDIAIVGAGHNGLVAASYLARAGRSVLVLERRERIGGACTLERPFADQRYAISPCAYLVGLLDPLVIDELELPRRGFEVRVADPELFIPLADGQAFVQWLDPERTAAGMRQTGFAQRDIDGLAAYNALFNRIRQLLREGERDTWVGESPTREEIEAMLGGERELTDVVFAASIAEVIEEYIADPRLRDALAPQGLIGAHGGPRTPGTAAIHLMHHMGRLEGHAGSWGYVRGGMGAVSLAIADAAREAGAEIACEASVSAIEPGRGVELEDGTRIDAETIVVNADPKVALGLLAAGGSLPEAYSERLRAWKTRSPVFKLNAALSDLPVWTAAGEDGSWPARGTVNVTLGLDACQRAFEAYEASKCALGYAELYFQTAADPSPAPEGKHLMSAFCQYAPYEPAEGKLDELRNHAAHAVIELIEQHAPGFKRSLEHHEVLLPADIEGRIGLTGGQIFQGECFPDQMWDQRLSPRTPVDGVYLCGAATHPGGSVIGLNGRNAAAAVLEGEILRSARSG